MSTEAGVQAILLAGDRGHARSVRGASKAFLPVAGRPMIVHVIEALLHTPEVTELFVVGDPIRLEKVIAEHGLLLLAASRSRPMHIVPQRSSLVENVWTGFLRTLPQGDPDERHPVLVVPSDIPLVVPEEISEFVRLASGTGADYVLGLTQEPVLLPYAPREGEPGIRMATFNLREGRVRQNNLHYVRPLRMGHRQYIQDMYENRYQKELGSMLRLGWRILRKEYRHLWVLFYYALMHLAGVLDRRGYSGASDRVRSWIPLARIEEGLSGLLATRVRMVMTSLGGAALDIDNSADLEVVDKMLFRWKERQARLVRVEGPDASQGTKKAVGEPAGP
ncbi:MAG: NTP transferase domain-containing protein [Myxococcota bacterium]